ncbi:PREDICTED: potassium channel subfamily K member 18 [Buceros rhinoceros silvestris]|uniref:potassium channel subfamily K member 18 n=1 Tax=Buceros rhinoceros silvestris TaxID=175836 RepID=UPI00052910B7|nr:PREDICTED: potassium channel subfamily K member 18 [Buceros rhinoceros silvestris]
MASNSQPLRGKRACKKIFWAVFPHACFILSLVIYAFLGALMFSHIEGNRKVNLSEEYREFLQNLWNISRNLSDNMTENEETFREKIHELLNGAERDWFVNPKDIWTFFGSLFFCCTVFTTVGYGNTYPVTRIGKYLCMLYALFGIPLMFLVLTDMGDILATVLSKSYNEFRKVQSKILASKFCSGFTCNKGDELKSRAQSKAVTNEPLTIMEVLKNQPGVKKKPVKYRNVEIFEMLIARENEHTKLARNKSIERWSSCPELARGKTMSRVMENFDKIGKQLEKLDVPIVLMVLVIFVYISCAAAILPNWETRLDFQEAFYFCFITLTTIGFGDTQLEHPKFFLFFSLYIIIGMEIVFIAFKLGQERLIVLYKKVISFCGEKKMPSKKVYPK